jgi:hypothetical protein
MQNCSRMKYLTVILFFALIAKYSWCQSHPPQLFFGEYEGIEIRYYQAASDTSNRAERMNETWGKKKLTLDSNGSFMLEFKVPYPTTRIGLTRTTKGKWVRKGDTLILNSHFVYTDFMKVKEKKRRLDSVQIKLKYTSDGIKYYPGL